MAFCTKCGTQMADGTAFCPSCGTAQSPQQPVYQQPVYQQPPYQQPPYQQPPYQQPVYQQPWQAEAPMKWYKFLIYFLLFASAVLNAITGVQMITGSMYGGSAEMVYVYFDGLQVLDVVMGLAVFGMVALAIFARFRLAGFYRNGPMLLVATYGANLVFYLIYMIGLVCILPTELVGELAPTFVGSMVGSIVMVIVNKIYFDKRKHLFVN